MNRLLLISILFATPNVRADADDFSQIMGLFVPRIVVAPPVIVIPPAAIYTAPPTYYPLPGPYYHGRGYGYSSEPGFPGYRHHHNHRHHRENDDWG